MKRVFKNNNLIVIAFLTIFSIVTTSAIAGEKHPSVPVELKLVGSIKNQPLFQLNFSGSAEENEFTIIIRDEAGNSFYRENIKGEVFSKKFLVNIDEMAETPLFFEIVSRKANKSVVYAINNTHRVVDEVVINQIK